MKLTYHIVNENELEPFVPELRSVEKKIEYPLENGTESFVIDHGKRYSPFFTQQGYKTKFLIIETNNMIVGSLVGVWKKISLNQKNYTGLYVSDLKLKSEYRGRGIIKRMLWYLFIRWPLVKGFKGWDFLYFCAMQRKSQGVDFTFKGAHLGKVTRPRASLNIYMLDAILLYDKKLDFFKLDYNNRINLSPQRTEDLLWNDGIKNIISTKKNSLIKLGHLNPELLQQGKEKRLNLALEAVLKRENSRVCFAVDTRDYKKIKRLKEIGITTKTQCNVFSFNPFSPSFKGSKTVSISTGEI